MTDPDSIRVFLHLLGVAGWVGGQIVMVGLLTLLRSLGPDVPRIAAVRFARVAWPCFGLAVVTGIWSLFAVEIGNHYTGYLTALLVKLLLWDSPGWQPPSTPPRRRSPAPPTRWPGSFEWWPPTPR